MILSDFIIHPLPGRERTEVRVKNKSPLILTFSRRETVS